MGGGALKLEVLAASCEEPVATHIRGSMLASSISILRARRSEHEYFRALPPAHHEAIRSLVAQAWLPMELGVAHYQAMAVVFPETSDQLENGRLAAARAQNGYVQTIAKALHATGSADVTLGLKRIPGVIGRIVRGGECEISLAGPKDARIELRGFPILATAYVHNAWQGMFESSLGVFSRRIFVRQDLAYGRADRMALQVSWV